MSETSHSAAAHGHGHDHGHDAHDHGSHKKVYWTVGIALLAGTVITVLAREWEFNSAALTISIALFIASIKAFLVAGYFMHLISEKKMIYLTLVTTAIFFVGMIGLILWSDADLPRDSAKKTHYVP